MDPNGIFARNHDESLIRELPHLRIAPLREPVSSRNLRIPLTLEPNASGSRESSTISKAGGSAVGILPARNNEPNGIATEASIANTARLLAKNELSTSELLVEPQPPPRPILPAFVNLRALERFPYSSFDDDSHQTRKRRRLGVGADIDVQPDSFGELLQLPMPQAQKEQRPPPFGPFAILNGLNEPPPNAALLPPIEAGSITQLLTKPSRDHIDVEPEPEQVVPTTSLTPDVQNGERIEGRIADILDSPIAEKPDLRDAVINNDETDKTQPEKEPSHAKELQPPQGTDLPPSPKTRGRSRKNLRKWTDEETAALLRGVMKCGIGNWKEVLAQDESSFNRRTASNLKDRFRVCCPSAYRASDPNEAIQHLRDALAKTLARIEGDAPATSSLTHSGSSSSFSSLDTSQNTPEHHSQSDSMPETNQTLPNKSEPATGNLSVISEPYTPAKARRRSRRPFTATEDEALLKGYAVHGFQWTLIQQDKKLNLGHRRATDLRDRFRTKFPHAYRDGSAIRDSTLQAQMAKDTIVKDGTIPAVRSRQGPQDSKPASTSDRSGKPISLSGVGSVDPVLPSLALPPVARESSTGVPLSGLSFLLEEGSTNEDSVDLPPLIWDDLP
ncbi:telomere repeat binding factor family protein [Aspergillus foveolatus]|uniref:telomere repeat binding factor family protein n=1 Tax=Aspergillus foveolatus TaxID=210207 RepID=UPI003CCCEE67